jgi:hypothetical protein
MGQARRRKLAGNYPGGNTAQRPELPLMKAVAQLLADRAPAPVSTASAGVAFWAHDAIGEMPDIGGCHVLLGSRGQLTKRLAKEMGRAFRQLRERQPTTPIGLLVDGYNDDPRDLWEVPEVCRYVQWWARFAGLSDWRIAETIPWHSDDDLALLARCGAFGDDHPFIIRPQSVH